jgi:hypothetical protein
MNLANRKKEPILAPNAVFKDGGDGPCAPFRDMSRCGCMRPP